MNENFYNPRKLRPVNVSNDMNKNNGNNFSHNQLNTRQSINHNSSGSSHLAQNLLPQLVNLISPQIPVSQSANQTLINMGFNAPTFLQNQLYSIPNTFGALNTLASQSYGTNNVSYMNNMRINHSHTQPAQSIMTNNNNNKTNQIINNEIIINSRKPKSDGTVKNNNPIKSTNYPVRLLINSELVGPLIGRKGEKIKEITANTGAKIDIKRESVPYSQFGLNNYMFSGCNRKGGNGDNNGDQIMAGSNASRGESQIVFIVSEPEKCSAAISEIMQLCTQESKEQGREEPNMGLLAEDRFCARLIGKEGRFLNWVRCKSGSQVHVSNVPTITTLSEQPHVISLDRIISCRGGGLASLLEAEKLISDKIRQCVSEDNAQKPCPRMMAKDDSFLPPRATADLSMFGRMYAPDAETTQRRGPPPPHPHSHPHHHPHHPALSHVPPPLPPTHASIIGSGIVHKANPNWPDNLKLDENLYVRIPQVCAGSIIGSEGKSVRRIMAETGTYIQISKSNLGVIESVPAVHTYRKQPVPECWMIKDELNERLITIKGSAPSQCSALTHIFSRVRICYSTQQQQQQHQQTVANDDPHHHHHNQQLQQQQQQQQPVRLWVLIRVPKLMLGRLIGKEGKVIRQLQLSSRTFLSFPRLKSSTQAQTQTQTQTQQIIDVIDENIAPNPADCQDNINITITNNTCSSSITTSNNNNNNIHDEEDDEDEDGDEEDDNDVDNLITAAAISSSPPPPPPVVATSSVDQHQQHKKRNSSHSNETLHNPDLALFGDPDLHPVEIFGTYEAVETAIYMIRRLIYSSIFSQFGPALIPGPAPQLPPPFQQMPPPHHHHHTLLMPPPPPPPASIMMSTNQRRNSDCLGGGQPSFFNNISHNIHPAAAAAAAAFMQQAIRAPSHHHHHHLNKHYNNNNNNNGGGGGGNNKKPISYNQRSKIDHRSQSDSKVKIEIDEIVDNKCLEDDIVFKEDVSLNGVNSNLESDCTSLSSKCVLLKGHQESSGIFPPPPDAQFAQASAHPREDINQIFNPSSPCSYFTDCCSNTSFLNMSTSDELSFITAQDSFSTSRNDSFTDVPPHSQQSQPQQQSQQQQHTQSMQNNQQSSQSPLQTSPQQTSSSSASFSPWSNSPNQPF